MFAFPWVSASCHSFNFQLFLMEITSRGNKHEKSSAYLHLHMWPYNPECSLEDLVCSVKVWQLFFQWSFASIYSNKVDKNVLFHSSFSHSFNIFASETFWRGDEIERFFLIFTSIKKKIGLDGVLSSKVLMHMLNAPTLERHCSPGMTNSSKPGTFHPSPTIWRWLFLQDYLTGFVIILVWNENK